MQTLKELYKAGLGPSSSHTMGPRALSENFRSRTESAASYRVTLYGSLAATGKGHLTDWAVEQAFKPVKTEIIWKPEEVLPVHPNGLKMEALDSEANLIASEVGYSIGGGTVADQDGHIPEKVDVYKETNMAEVLAWCDKTGRNIWELVIESEGPDILDYLKEIWEVMSRSVVRGLENEGVLPGGLNLPRKATSYHIKALQMEGFTGKISRAFAYALAVSEENASGGIIVTAPTCGSCGVVPAVLSVLKETHGFAPVRIYRALATAGLVGNLVKTNGSISGAEVGCQGEVGTACAMAAAAAAQLLGGTPRQIEYAAEMGLEHHLGLTCDPVAGLVQIPCIERNAMAATRAIDCATYAILSDGRHRISFDEVVQTMTQTGRDLNSCYRETSTGGLAMFHRFGEPIC